MNKKKTWYSVLGVGASLILSKLKYVLIVFKVGKIGFTFISMLVTIWTYSLIYGWKFAVGFVLLLFIHENGHLLAAKMKKLNVTKPVFIPFVGAVIALKEQPKDASTEAFIAIGGPLAGGFASLICYLLFLFDRSGLFLSFAYTGFFLNLFNLIPVHPLDGGRIVTAISTKLWVLGLAVLSYFAFNFESPLLFIILILGVIQAWKTYRNKNMEYYAVSSRERGIYTLSYFSLVAMMSYMTMHTFHLLHAS